jgi:hypothetical protein
MSVMKRWLMSTLTFLKCLMRNMLLISSVWKTWRRSGAPSNKGPRPATLPVDGEKRVSVKP